MRILLAPNNTAGYYSQLLLGFRELGIKCDLVTRDPHPFGYWEPPAQGLIRLVRFFGRLAQSSARPHSVSSAARLLYIFSYCAWTIVAIFRYDTFVFASGQSLWPTNRDLPLLKLLKKTIVSNISHGSEARPAFMNGAMRDRTNGRHPTVRDLSSRCEKQAQMVKRQEEYASVVIASVMSSHFLTLPFISSSAIGLPTGDFPDQSRLRVPQPEGEGPTGPIQIVHAPSHKFAKGSREIETAIANLAQKGHEIDFLLLEGLENQSVLEKIMKCDFVVDQLFSDGPLPGLATEAAWLGKPSVVGGYGLKMRKELVSEEMWPPSAICSPEDLEPTIEKLITDREYRRKLGREARQFVQERWARREVAAKYLRIIKGLAPKDWWADPVDVIYVYGACQDATTTARLIRDMVSWGGPRALGVSRTELRRALLQFSRNRDRTAWKIP